MLQTSDSSDEDDEPLRSNPRRRKNTAVDRTASNITPSTIKSYVPQKFVGAKTSVGRTRMDDTGEDKSGEHPHTPATSLTQDSRPARKILLGRMISTDTCDHANTDVVHELKKNTALMEEIIQQMKATQRHVEAIEDKLLESTGPSSSGGSCSTTSRSKRKQKLEIPRHVKV